VQISFGNGGWCLVDADIDLPGRLYVRITEVEGQPRLTELYIDGRGERISPRALRSLPLAAIEEWASDGAARRRGVASPDLSRLASHYATWWDSRTYAGRHCDACGGPVRGKHPLPSGERAMTDWPAMSWYAQGPESGIGQSPMGRERDHAKPPKLKLDPPEDGRLTDEFLRSVALAYEAAIARLIHAPAKKLGTLAGVSDRTVHRWVYLARKRGLMAPAKHKGRVV
jgi:hypothetical protein